MKHGQRNLKVANLIISKILKLYELLIHLFFNIIKICKYKYNFLFMKNKINFNLF